MADLLANNVVALKVAWMELLLAAHSEALRVVE